MRKYLREIEISTFLYKAFHWKEYERENKQYIMIILLTIAILFFQMLTRR